MVDKIIKQIPALVIATTNQGKVAEIQSLLKGFKVNIKTLNDFGPIPPVVENGESFDENAYKKSSFTARILGLPVLSDDSGLLVEALAGAPGVKSSRYGGPGASDEQKCSKLLKNLGDEQNRKAAFECVISIAVPGGAALTYEARCDGLITHEPAGTNGFGYDSIFYYPPLKKTFAQMSMVEKNKVSHRGKALAELKDEFNKVLIWIEQQMPIIEKFNYKS